MLNNDYKNGYNQAVEDFIQETNVILRSGCDINLSIGDVIREIRRNILNRSYGRLEIMDKVTPHE
jgi:hypothetical protein